MLLRIYHIDPNALRWYYFDGGRIYAKHIFISYLHNA